MERTIAIPKTDTGMAAKRYVVGWLVGLNGAMRGESFPVRIGRNVLGRDKKSDIVNSEDEFEFGDSDRSLLEKERSVAAFSFDSIM